MALIAPLFAGTAASRSLKIRLSRAATFQSLSLLAICAYFAVMAMLATALAQPLGPGRRLTVIILAVMLDDRRPPLVLLSQRARGGSR